MQPPFYSENIEEMYRRILNQHTIEFTPDVSGAAQDIIVRMLAYDKNERLGADATGGAAAVRAHPFFAEIDWPALEQKRMQPPFRPKVFTLVLFVVVCVFVCSFLDTCSVCSSP